jgi:hypothetical protein
VRSKPQLPIDIRFFQDKETKPDLKKLLLIGYRLKTLKLLLSLQLFIQVLPEHYEFHLSQEFHCLCCYQSSLCLAIVCCRLNTNSIRPSRHSYPKCSAFEYSMDFIRNQQVDLLSTAPQMFVVQIWGTSQQYRTTGRGVKVFTNIGSSAVSNGYLMTVCCRACLSSGIK